MPIMIFISVANFGDHPLEAENIPLTNLLFYILDVLDPYRFKSSNMAV